MAKVCFYNILLLISVFPAILCQGPLAGFPVTDCGVTKQCVGSPDSGCLKQGICSELVKYTFDPSKPDQVAIDLYGLPPTAGFSNFWVAVGFNHNPSSMAGTLVTECVYNKGQVDVFSSYNADNGYINQRLSQPKLGISSASGSLANGVLSCSFMLDRARVANGKDFNLSTPLYVVLGDGPATEWLVKPHMATPSVSNDAVVFASATQPSTAYPNLDAIQTIAPAPVTPVDLNGDGSSVTVSRVQAGSAPTKIDGCAVTKSCLATPAGCLTSDSCQAVVSYMADKDRPGNMVFELLRTMTAQGDQYVSVGFSKVSPSMSGSGVVACVGYGNNLDVLSSYNPGYYNMPVDNPKENITLLQTSADGQHQYCKFSMPTKKSFRGKFADSPVELDLNNPTFLLLAFGPAKPTGGLSKHPFTPMVTSEPVQLAKIGVAAGQNKDKHKAHAGLMTGAWMFLASVGIFTARYYKNMWLDYQPCGLKMWFHIHRPVMLLAVSASIAAFVIIFERVRAWTSTPVSENPHPIIGIVAFGLALIQPIMAFFRPHPGAKLRPIFNWAHFLVGFSAHILAITAIFYGFGMPQLLSSSAAISCQWILVAFCVFHGSWLILVQLIDMISPRFARPVERTTMQMKTVNGNGTVFQETVNVTSPVRDPASTIKTVLWIIHLLVVAGLTIAILIIIGLAA